MLATRRIVHAARLSADIRISNYAREGLKNVAALDERGGGGNLGIARQLGDTSLLHAKPMGAAPCARNGVQYGTKIGVTAYTTRRTQRYNHNPPYFRGHSNEGALGMFDVGPPRIPRAQHGEFVGVGKSGWFAGSVELDEFVTDSAQCGCDQSRAY